MQNGNFYSRNFFLVLIDFRINHIWYYDLAKSLVLALEYISNLLSIIFSYYKLPSFTKLKPSK